MTPNPFTTLGLAPQFALDRKLLDAAYRQLSKSLHPDRHVQAAAAQRRRVLASAIDVGDAYRLLKDPLRRAKWLIDRAAHLAGQGASVSQQLERADPEFLMDIMEQREALSEARRSGNLCEAQALATPIREREATALTELSQALDSGPVARLLADSAASDDSSETRSSAEAVDDDSSAASDPALATALSSAAGCLSRLRYLRRFLDEVAAMEDELD